jgi:hypothetical protein
VQRDNPLLCFALVVTFGSVVGSVNAQDRDTKVRDDRQIFLKRDAWVYNNLAASFAEARDSKKPILAVLRCVP